MSADGQGALIVLERETGLEEVAETGVMIHGDVSADLLRTIFMPRSALHDGAVIIRDDRIVAAGALLPLAETSIHTERFGTRHRAALGITEQTDAVVVVVSEENGQISLVERARIVRNLTEAGLARAIQGLLDPAGTRRGAFGWRTAAQAGTGGRSPRIRELGRFVGRTSASGGGPTTTAVPVGAVAGIAVSAASASATAGPPPSADTRAHARARDAATSDTRARDDATARDRRACDTARRTRSTSAVAPASTPPRPRRPMTGLSRTRAPGRRGEADPRAHRP